jgi:hypothetical protein
MVHQNLLYHQVTLNEVHQMVAALKISLFREKPFLKTLLHGIYKKSSKLVKHLRVSTSGMKTYPSGLKVEQMIHDLHHGKERKLTVCLKNRWGGHQIGSK